MMKNEKKYYSKYSTEIDAAVVVVIVIVVIVVDVKTLTDQPVIVEEDAFYGRPHISFNFIMHVAVGIRIINRESSVLAMPN